MSSVFNILIRTSVGFVLLLILTIILGKKQLSQLTVFTYITGIALGSMMSEMALNEDVHFVGAILAMAVWCVLVVIVEYVSLKSAKARVLMDGEPSIVIKHGLIQEDQLKKHRLNIDDLSMQLRLKSIFSILDVEYGILEPNGVLTIMKKASKEFVTREEMNIIPPPSQIPTEIIVDGKLVEKNLPEVGLTNDDIYHELQKQDISDIKDVLYAEMQQDRSIYIQKRSS